MTTSNDTSALATREAIVIDGPNSVTGAPRQGFPQAAPSLGVSVVALVLAFFVLRRSGRDRILAAALVLACLPGLWSVLVLRADAPARRDELASSVTATLRQLAEHSGWPAAPAMVSQEADVLFPLLRYTMPSRPQGSAVKLFARGNSLDVTCVRTDDVVECGAPE